MHKLCVVVVAAFVSAFAIPAFAEEPPPVSLTKGCQVDVLNSDQCPQIRIQARANRITITKVAANRGNCVASVQQKGGRSRYSRGGIGGQFYTVDELVPLALPHSLVFGEAIYVHFSCDPIEVEVTTDQDSFIFTFDE